MKTLLTLTLVAALALLAAPLAAHAGNCDFSSGRASDGSRCGGRSAESRPGGYNPYNPYGN